VNNEFVPFLQEFVTDKDKVWLQEEGAMMCYNIVVLTFGRVFSITISAICREELSWLPNSPDKNLSDFSCVEVKRNSSHIEKHYSQFCKKYLLI
jgi:hypothetical protein